MNGLCIPITTVKVFWDIDTVSIKIIFILVDPFCYKCFTFVFIILSCLFLAALWTPAVKGLTSLLFDILCDVSLCYCHFHIWCLGSGLVLDCINS